MLKKVMALATLVCTVPALANAWTLSTWAKSGGGNIAVTYGAGQPTNQTSVNGLKFKTYTTSVSNPNNVVPVSVTPANGYYISTLVLDGVTTTGTAASPVAPYNGSVTGPGTHSVYATFRPGPISVTATATAGGTISPSSINSVYFGQTLVQKIKFTATPQAGYLAVISAPGCTVVNPGVVGAPAYAVIPAGTTLTAPIAISATFTGAGANAGVPQTVLVASPAPTVTLDGSGSAGATSYAWVQTSGPAVTLSSATAQKPTFTPSVVGDYGFSLTINGGTTASTTVHYVASATAAAYNQCIVCHAANGVGAGIYANWSTSIHSRSTHGICAGCHYGTNTGSHPGTVNTGTVDPTTFLVKVNGVVGGNGNVVNTGAVFCTTCHNGTHPIPHPTAGLDATQACQNCHTTAGAGDAHQLQPAGVVSTALDNCTICHNDTQMVGLAPANVNATCATCHTSSAPHAFQATSAISTLANNCVGCHDVAIQHPGALVSDNAGVRQITGAGGEFDASTRNNSAGYRSHHIYNGAGVDPQNAQCIACHLEGKVGPNRTVVLDPTYHMADAKVHLRSGNTAITPNVAWDPANPVHSDMDNFCMSCHNAAGAVSAYANMSSALKGMTAINGALPASAKNPFGDLLKNAYDGLVRPQVVAVYEQFDTGNVAHHAVRGKKYAGAYRTGNPNNVVTTGHTASTGNFTQYSGATNGNIHITASTGAPQVEQYFGTYSTAGPAAGFDGGLSSGSRKTLYEAGLFVAQYTTLSGSTVGDDSSLHCGDCHSVGQWAPNSAKAVIFNNSSSAQFGYSIQNTTIAIGAHGSKNEYMLRTSNGSDALHTQGSTAKSSGSGATTAYRASSNGTYVCYLCHLQAAYGDNNYFKTDAGVGVTSFRDHAGLHYNGGCDSSAQQTVGKTGYVNRIGAVGSGKLGTVFGYTCAHCHSAGNQLFGGIHGNSAADGSAKNVTFLSYSTDGTDIIGSTLPGGYSTRSYATEHDTLNAVARLPYRFMGGTGLRYNGGGSASKWEAKTLNGKHREGCYNLNATTATTALWNTTAPQRSLSGNTGNAILSNGGNDSAIGASDYSARFAQNNQTNTLGTANPNDVGAGWGACNHHSGSTTTSSTAPTRSVQRPLVY